MTDLIEDEVLQVPGCRRDAELHATVGADKFYTIYNNESSSPCSHLHQQTGEEDPREVAVAKRNQKSPDDGHDRVALLRGVSAAVIAFASRRILIVRHQPRATATENLTKYERQSVLMLLDIVIVFVLTFIGVGLVGFLRCIEESSRSR